MTAYQFFPAFNAYQAVDRVKTFYFTDVSVKEGTSRVKPGVQESGDTGLRRQAAEPFFQAKTHEPIITDFNL
jgi:hypothetical protein